VFLPSQRFSVRLKQSIAKSVANPEGCGRAVLLRCADLSASKGQIVFCNVKKGDYSVKASVTGYKANSSSMNTASETSMLDLTENPRTALREEKQPAN
jgi:hypothetical protein